MTEFTVTWSIEVDAENAEEAARLVRQKYFNNSDPENTATVFEVQGDGVDSGLIDLSDWTEPGTFADFVAFCKAQDPDRAINHSQNWEGCALGEYLDDRKLVRVKPYTAYSYELLKNNNLAVYGALNSKTATTYGELVELF